MLSTGIHRVILIHIPLKACSNITNNIMLKKFVLLDTIYGAYKFGCVQVTACCLPADASSIDKDFICSQPVDMRQAFDGLSGMVQDLMRQDTFTGHLFVFFSRCKSKVKILYWDRDGYVNWYKRLEHGRFLFDDWLQGRTESGIEIKVTEFAMLLGGMSSSSLRKQKRYSREKALSSFSWQV